jgi:FG-GAP-like repeat
MKEWGKITSGFLFLLVSGGLILLSLQLIPAQVKMKGKPVPSQCDADRTCESDEYNYSKSPEAQPCSDCRPKSYPSLAIAQEQLQIIGANSTIGKAYLFQWSDTNNCFQDTWASPNIAATTLYPDMGDVDGDGQKELVVVAEHSYKVGKGKNAKTYYDYEIYFYNDDGQLDFQSPAKFGYSTLNIQFGEVSTGDVDTDGKDELILVKIWSVEIYKYDATTNDFELKWVYQAGVDGSQAYGASVGNADIDAMNELILGTVDSGQAYIFDYLGEDNQGKFLFSTPIKTESMGGYIDIAKARDVDNDGLNEIIGCGNNGSLMVWKYENGTYKQKYLSDPLGTYTEEIDAADIDGDSHNEIVIWGTGVNTLYVLEYSDSDPLDDIFGAFSIVDELTIKDGIKELVVGDVNHDGKAEVVFGGASDGVSIYSFISNHLKLDYQCVYGSPGGPRIK